MNAAMPPARCALATACSANVDFPLLSGPYISPMRMTEPLPNCRSIWRRAASRALSLSPARSGLDLLFTAMEDSLPGLGACGHLPHRPGRLSFGPAGHPPAVIDGHGMRHH